MCAGAGISSALAMFPRHAKTLFQSNAMHRTYLARKETAVLELAQKESKEECPSHKNKREQSSIGLGRCWTIILKSSTVSIVLLQWVISEDL